MPRIRTLKPEHRQHRKVGALDHITYRLWVGMILEADDSGRLVYDAEGLRVLIFGYHPKVSRGLVEASARLLERLGLIRRYVAPDVSAVSAGQTYAYFPSWRDHQRLDHPTPSKLPDPKESVNPREESVNPREESVNPRESSRGKGRDQGSRIKDQGRDLSTTLSGDAPDAASLNGRSVHTQARQILAFLNHKAGRNYQPTAVNLDLIRARLKDGATVEQCRAIIGRKTAAWKGDAKMGQFLRPATLFNRTKFAQYLGELPATAFEPEETTR